MFERYTEKARRVIFFARYHASQFGSPYIEAEHLLLGFMQEDRGLFTGLSGALTVESLRQELQEQTPFREKTSTSMDLPLSHEAKSVLRFAAEEADGLDHRNIDTCHLLLALLRIETSGAAVFLRKHRLDYASYRELVRKSPAPAASGPPSAASRAEPALPPEEHAAPAAPSLAASITALRRLLEVSADPLCAYSDADAGHRLKRQPMSRKEALGHLVNLTMAHHLWLARALTEPKVAAGMYPPVEWAAAQQYEHCRWNDLVALWSALNLLLVHVLSGAPEAKVNTSIRAGIEEPQTLRSLIDRFVSESDDLMGQILARL
jgi:ClpA/ClpB-like protein